MVTAHLWVLVLQAPTFAPAPEAPADTVWFDPPLPLGTHFSHASLYGPHSKRRPPDATFEAIVRIDPFDTGTRWAYMKQRFGDHPSYEQILGAYGPALEWDLVSMRNIASRAKSNPIARREWLKRTCDSDPDYCGDLARFLVESGEEPAAAEAYRRWWREAIDRVGVANDVDWLVKYDVKHGRVDEAWKVARDAASTYSGAGLAHAWGTSRRIPAPRSVRSKPSARKPSGTTGPTLSTRSTIARSPRGTSGSKHRERP